MVEVNKETTKIKEIYEKKLTNMSRKMDKIELENVNLLEKNSLLHTEVRQIREDMAQIEHTATESLRMANWNEQYSRKKNIKIYNLKESRGEQLIQDFVSSTKDSVKVEIRPSEIVAMHRIPGKPGSPRPVIVKFLRMENKITILKNRKALQEKLDIKIGDDITHKTMNYQADSIDMKTSQVPGISTATSTELTWMAIGIDSTFLTILIRS